MVDPESAHYLLRYWELAAKTTLIPLDVTHQVLATKDIQDLILYGKSRDKRNTPSKLRTMLVELLLFFAKTYAEVFELTEGPPLHDPLAVAAILDGIIEHQIPFYDFDRQAAAQALYYDEEPRMKERFDVSVVVDGTHEEALAGKTETGRTVVSLLEKGEAGVKIPRGLNVPKFWEVIEQCIERADAKNASSSKAGASLRGV